jgi:hypothetical protein
MFVSFCLQALRRDPNVKVAPVIPGDLGLFKAPPALKGGVAVLHWRYVAELC